MEFRILGPVEVVRDGELLDLGGPRQRAVLARLLLAAGAVVPAGVLVDDVWLGRPPATAAKTLQKYVSELRKILGHDVLRTQGGGYAARARWRRPRREPVRVARRRRRVRPGAGAVARRPARRSSRRRLRGCRPHAPRRAATRRPRGEAAYRRRARSSCRGGRRAGAARRRAPAAGAPRRACRCWRCTARAARSSRSARSSGIAGGWPTRWGSRRPPSSGTSKRRSSARTRRCCRIPSSASPRNPPPTANLRSVRARHAGPAPGCRAPTRRSPVRRS